MAAQKQREPDGKENTAPEGPPALRLIVADETSPGTIATLNGEERYVSAYCGDAKSSGPQNFLVGMPPHGNGRPHFHGGDQFQVFFGTPGSIYQRHPVTPVTVDYSDAYTP